MTTQIDLSGFENKRQVLPRRRRVPEGILLRFRVKHAVHRIEFSQVDCENEHYVSLRGFGVEFVASVKVTRARPPLESAI